LAPFSQLLIATGGTPKVLPVMKTLAPEVAEHVTTYRKLSDFKKLEALTASGNKHIAVVGGGFLGSELACSLAHRGMFPLFVLLVCSANLSSRQPILTAKNVPGLKVTQVFPEEGNMGLVFPRYLSEWTTGRLRQGLLSLCEPSLTLLTRLRVQRESTSCPGPL